MGEETVAAAKDVKTQDGCSAESAGSFLGDGLVILVDILRGMHKDDLWLILTPQREHLFEYLLPKVWKTAGFELPKFDLVISQTQLVHAVVVLANQMQQIRVFLVI